MTKKQQLIQRLNELRTKNSLPIYDPKKVTMNCEEIEALIYHLETPSHMYKDPPPPQESIAGLLKKLNALRKKAGEKPLAGWKANRADLEKAIMAMQKEIVEEALLKHKRGKTKIAQGADTRKTHTDMHNNPIVEDMKKMRRKEERLRIAKAKDTARKIALWAGYSTANVLAYLLAKNLTTPALAGDTLKADIKAWLSLREEVMPQRRGKPRSPLRVFVEAESKRLVVPERALQRWLEANGLGVEKPLSKAQERALRAFLKAQPKQTATGQKRPRSSGSVTPQALADELGLDAKAVRVRLRKLEPRIKAIWRMANERWGFEPEHKSDVLKLIKGEK